MVSADRISALENGDIAGMLDTYVRLAGSLSITLNDLLAGVTWTPAPSSLSSRPGTRSSSRCKLQRAMTEPGLTV
jgi:hypothetical protein